MSKVQNFLGVGPKSPNEMYTRVKIKYLRYLLKVSLRVIHLFIYIYIYCFHYFRQNRDNKEKKCCTEIWQQAEIPIWLWGITAACAV